MNRSINILFHDALTDENRIFEVVPAPRHERHEHIAAERKLSHLRGGAISDNIAGLDLVADDYDRPLVNAGILIRALILNEIVDIDARIPRTRRLVGLDDNAGGVDAFHDPVPPRHNGHARVPRHRLFHAGSDERSLGAEQRHRLPLHVRAHQRSVSVVVFQERNQRCGYAHELVG